MGAVDAIKLLFNYGAYHFTEHVFTELDNDGFTIYDIECVIAGGKTRKTWPRENKYEVVGKAFDGRPLAFVCRITPNNKLIIITAYEDKIQS